MKNPFKQLNLVDTASNLVLGGGANVAMNVAVSKIDALAGLSKSTVDWIKVGVGVLGGVVFKNKYARQAFDGLATVGASEIVSEWADSLGVTDPVTPTTGLPKGTVGRLVEMGQRDFIRRYKKKVAGVGNATSAVISK